MGFNLIRLQPRQYRSTDGVTARMSFFRFQPIGKNNAPRIVVHTEADEFFKLRTVWMEVYPKVHPKARNCQRIPKRLSQLMKQFS